MQTNQAHAAAAPHAQPAHAAAAPAQETKPAATLEQRVTELEDKFNKLMTRIVALVGE